MFRLIYCVITFTIKQNIQMQIFAIRVWVMFCDFTLTLLANIFEVCPQSDSFDILLGS